MKTSSTFKQVWTTFPAADYLIKSVEKGTKACGRWAWGPRQSKRVQGKEIIDTGKNNNQIYPGSLKHRETKIIQHALHFSLKMQGCRGLVCFVWVFLETFAYWLVNIFLKLKSWNSIAKQWSHPQTFTGCCHSDFIVLPLKYRLYALDLEVNNVSSSN